MKLLALLIGLVGLAGAVFQFDRRVDIMGFDVPRSAPVPSYTSARIGALQIDTTGLLVPSSGTNSIVITGTTGAAVPTSSAYQGTIR